MTPVGETGEANSVQVDFVTTSVGQVDFGIVATSVLRILSARDWDGQVLDDPFGKAEGTKVHDPRVLVLAGYRREGAVRVRGAVEVRSVRIGDVMPLPPLVLRQGSILLSLAMHEGQRPLLIVDPEELCRLCPSS